MFVLYHVWVCFWCLALTRDRALLQAPLKEWLDDAPPALSNGFAAESLQSDDETDPGQDGKDKARETARSEAEVVRLDNLRKSALAKGDTTKAGEYLQARDLRMQFFVDSERPDTTK